MAYVTSRKETSKMTFHEITQSANAAFAAGTSRAEFLSVIPAMHRSDAAMQFDRSAELTATTEPSEREIQSECRKLAYEERLYEAADESQWGTKLATYVLSGRLMSAGMMRGCTTCIAYASQIELADIGKQQEQAIANLTADQRHLKNRGIIYMISLDTRAIIY